MVSATKQAGNIQHVDLDPDFLEHEYDSDFGGSFRSAGMPDELSIHWQAHELANEVDELQLAVETAEREDDERPMTLAEAGEFLAESAPGLPFALSEFHYGYTGMPAGASGHFTPTDVCTARCIKDARVWEGENWREVMNRVLVDLFPPPPSAKGTEAA